MLFITFVLKNLIRRPLRLLLTLFAIAIAVGAVVALVGVANGFERTFTNLYENADVSMVVVRTGARQRMSSTLDEGLAAKIQQVSGVKEVLFSLTDVVSFEEAGLYSVVVQGWEPDTAVFQHLTIKEGRTLRHDDTRNVLLGTILANSLGKKVGDQVEIVEKESFTVVGIYESRNIFENGGLVVPLKELQRIMDRPGKVTGFSLVLEKNLDEAALKEVRNQVEALAPGLSALPVADHIKSLSEIRLAKAMAWLTSWIALVIGFFAMVNTMVMSVHERTHEIGILRAVGWRVRRVVRMVVLEAVFLSIVGALCGMVGAAVLVKLLTRMHAVSGLIEGRIAPIFFVDGFVIAVILGLLGSILPAIRGARMLPTEALRHE